MTLSVAIFNHTKVKQAAFVADVEKIINSDDPGFYNQTMLDDMKAKLSIEPDTIEVLRTSHVIYHGPFPLISQFNFKPGLATIHSSIHYADFICRYLRLNFKQCTHNTLFKLKLICSLINLVEQKLAILMYNFGIKPLKI